MKWLLLLPIWVFFICYVVWKMGDDGAGSPGPQVYRHTDPQGLPASPVPAKAGQSVRRAQQVSGAQMAIVAGKLRERVQLLPVIEDGCGLSPLWPIETAGDIVPKLATCPGFPSWRLFESGELSFYIPEGKGMRVEVMDSGGSIPMTGELFYRNETSPDRWYRIVGGDNITWGALSVDEGILFDDRERHPVSETFHNTMVRGGGIARFSLDSGGYVCRAEWLGEGKRVSLLGWQHSSMHRDAYLVLAASVELGNPLRRPESQLKDIVKAMTVTARLKMGLLERGMRRGEVQEVLGKPVGVAGGVWLYHAPHRNGDEYYRVAFGKDGTFRGLKSDWIEIRKDPPILGTIAWMLEKTEIRAGKAGGIGYDIGALSDKDVVLIFEQVRQRIPSAGGEQWTGLCRVLANLADLGLQDDGILQLLRVRFIEDELPIRPAIALLWKWDPAAGRNLFVQKAKDILGSLRWQSPAPRSVAGNVGDLHVLLDFIGGSHSASGELLKGMVDHPHIEVRVTGFSFWRWLKGADLRKVTLKGLTDASDRVRLYCAEALASGCAIPADSNFLQERLKEEHVAGIRDHLTTAITALQEP
ncbi:MAG: hypothetical protein VCA55_03480 [Verrucomicrobiales bacterium]